MWEQLKRDNSRAKNLRKEEELNYSNAEILKEIGKDDEIEITTRDGHVNTGRVVNVIEGESVTINSVCLANNKCSYESITISAKNIRNVDVLRKKENKSFTDPSFSTMKSQ